MNEPDLRKRIVIDSHILSGKPCIGGTRLSVEFIVGLLAQGVTRDEIINEYLGLTLDDILACEQYNRHYNHY